MGCETWYYVETKNDELVPNFGLSNHKTSRGEQSENLLRKQIKKPDDKWRNKVIR